MICRWLAVVACWLMVLSTLPSPVLGQETSLQTRAGQAIRGHLFDLEANAPVSTGTITLLSGDQRLRTTVTNEEGYFFLSIAEPGEYQLEGRRLGYATTVSQAFQITSGDTLTVRFVLVPSAVLLDPLVVVGNTNRGMRRFSDHMEAWGKGLFLTPEMIDSIAPRHYGDVFRQQEGIWLSWGWGQLSTGTQGPVPTVRTYQGHGCMAYVVDRIRIGPQNRYILEAMDPKSIVAVEMYRGPAEVPPDLRHQGGEESNSTRTGAFGLATYSDPRFWECGVVVYWTNAGW